MFSWLRTAAALFLGTGQSEQLTYKVRLQLLPDSTPETSQAQLFSPFPCYKTHDSCFPFCAAQQLTFQP